MNGVVASEHECPGILIYSGAAGEGGVCNWPGAIVCRDTTAQSGGDNHNIIKGTEEPTRQPTNQPKQSKKKKQKRKKQKKQTKQKKQPKKSSRKSKNSSTNRSNPQNFFCGVSADDAKNHCIPCPKGTTAECGANISHGCFRGISECASRGSGGGGNKGYQSSAQPRDPPPPPTPFNLNLQLNPKPSPAAFEPRTAEPKPAPAALNLPPAVTASSPTPRNSPPNPSPSGDQYTNNWTNAPYKPYRGPHRSKTVIGYYASWQWYDRNKFADPQKIDFTKYDRINYAFFQPDAEGNLFGTDEWADPQLLWGPIDWSGGGTEKCSWDKPESWPDRKDGSVQYNCQNFQLEKGILHLAQSKGVEVMPSIGGWTLSDFFPGIAASPQKRRHFAKQCRKLIEEYGFDGIDIDWEYPAYADHSGTPEDKGNYPLFLQAIRDELDSLGAITGRHYGITAALPCGPDKIDAGIDVPEISRLLDELNLMTYDLHGSWDTLAGTNAPMYDQGWGDGSPRWSVHGCVENYRERGAPMSKINLGLPFYGRSVKRATGFKQWHTGADDDHYHLDEGSPQYFNIIPFLEDGSLTSYRHERTQTQYAVFDKGGGLVSYDDPQAICDKVGYANDRGLHGFLIWEISGDMLDDGTTPLIDATNGKIENPGYDCGALRDPVRGLKWRPAPPEPAEVDWTGYTGPARTGGSGNDFNGAVTAGGAPAPPVIPPAGGGDGAYVSPQNFVWESGGDAVSDAGEEEEEEKKKKDDDCPLSYTGYFPTKDCTGYMYCSNGSAGAVMPCVPGTLFDKSITACAFASTVTGCDG